MKDYNVPIQSLIDHIKTATDVDPWAKEMAEDLLKEQEELVRCKDCVYDGKPRKCVVEAICNMRGVLKAHIVDGNWYCADGKRE